MKPLRDELGMKYRRRQFIQLRRRYFMSPRGENHRIAVPELTRSADIKLN